MAILLAVGAIVAATIVLIYRIDKHWAKQSMDEFEDELTKSDRDEKSGRE